MTLTDACKPLMPSARPMFWNLIPSRRSSGAEDALNTAAQPASAALHCVAVLIKTGPKALTLADRPTAAVAAIEAA